MLPTTTHRSGAVTATPHPTEPAWHPERCGDLTAGAVIGHGSARRVVAVTRIREIGGAELVRIDLETGEQMHRYTTDLVVVYGSYPRAPERHPARAR